MAEYMKQEVQFIVDLVGNKSGRMAIPDGASYPFGPEAVLGTAGCMSASLIPMEDHHHEIT